MFAYVLTYVIITAMPGQQPRVEQFERPALLSVEQCLRVTREVQRNLRRGQRLHRPVCERRGWAT